LLANLGWWFGKHIGIADAKPWDWHGFMLSTDVATSCDKLSGIVIVFDMFRSCLLSCVSLF